MHRIMLKQPTMTTIVSIMMMICFKKSQLKYQNVAYAYCDCAYTKMVQGSIQWTDKKRETKELQQIMEGAREIERLWSIARLPIRLE